MNFSKKNHKHKMNTSKLTGKTIKLLALAIVLIGFSSCSSDDDNGPQHLALESEQVNNLYAPLTNDFGQPPAGPFIKFDFSTGMITTSETEWDIAFRSTAIIVNGGVSQGLTDEPERNGGAAAYITENTFDEVIEVNPNLFVQDSETSRAIPTGSGNGWYNYDGTNQAAPRITPIPGRILVFKTRDGRYAKIDILNYYKDNPSEITDEIAQNDFRYYTFNYSFQPNEGITTFE